MFCHSLSWYWKLWYWFPGFAVFQCPVAPRIISLQSLGIYLKIKWKSCCFSHGRLTHFIWPCIVNRIWYGSYSAVGGWVFSHSRGRHLLPSSGCGVQWIRHLRYSLICAKEIFLCPEILNFLFDYILNLKHESFVWNLRQLKHFSMFSGFWIMKDLKNEKCSTTFSLGVMQYRCISLPSLHTGTSLNIL